MKNILKCTTAFFFVALIIGSLGCGKDDPGGGGVFLPDLTRQWFNKADANDIFIFNADKPTQNISTFTGSENGLTFTFTGSYTNHDIQFTYSTTSGNKSGKSYSGTINDASTVITLNSSQLGSLVLEKR